MKKLFLLLIGFSLLILSIKMNYVGAVTGTNLRIINSFFLIFSLIFFIFSIILFITNKSLESLIIPTGSLEADKKRVKTAMKNYFYADTKDSKPYVLISGEIQRDENERPKKDSQQYLIYKELRKNYGLNPSDLIIEGKSKDTLENFLYSIEKLKKRGISNIKIVTNPTHYWRFKLFENEAKKENLIDDSFKIEPIYTNESLKEFIYGVLAYVKDYIRLKTNGSLEKAKKK